MSGFEVSERLADQREIEDVRHKAALKSHDLEKRSAGLERLVGFLTELLVGMIAAGVAALAAIYFSGGDYSSVAAVEIFIGVFFATNFVFRKLAGWCLG